MIQKYLSDKKVFWISMFFAIGGLISPLFTLQHSSELLKMIGSHLKSLVEILHVSFFNNQNDFSIEILPDENGTYILYNLLVGFFFVLLLIGSVLYLTSKSKETRLLRFVFSIAFVSKIAQIIVWIIYVLAYIKTAEPRMYVHLLISFLIYIFQIYLIYTILKYIAKSKMLSTSIREYGEKQRIVLNETSRWTRFFHHITDILVMILTLSPIAIVVVRIPFVENFVKSIAQFLGDRPTVALISAFFIVIYYFICELTFGMTAAKMLSETRVVDENGNHPTMGKIAKRSFLRLVPFENFTFFMAAGLHDRSSETYVVNEERTGIRGSWYFLLIPIFLIIGGGTFFIIDAREKAEYQKNAMAESLQERELFIENIKNLSTDEVLELSAINYDAEDIYLKVENISKDSVTFMIIDSSKEYKNDDGEIISKYRIKDNIEKIYEIEKKTPTIINFSKNELLASKNTTKSDYDSDVEKGINVLGKQFSVKNIESYFGPNFKISDITYGSQDRVILANYGWPADLIEISNAELQSGQLPMRIDKTRRSSAELVAKTKGNFSITIKAKDTLNRIFTYEISQKENLPAVIKKIK